MISYLGTSDIAEWFGVDRATIVQWRRRYPDFPAPDAAISSTAGWLPQRKAEIVAWEASRPGRGAGGGRPRKAPDIAGTGR